ncbi:ANTAR domain-containing protein [Cryptosporangium aurantiacum]|uniref:ANTAR domain-containing protein n=1 Tax=Cryptosporangium aurantiacum TaxID=134849 RepID=A0A1M7QXB0_9ACTN|nr:ANTAR domain-containing protein [Cryptosporangium aurantiacum]SHN36657.1 ANTAR domain-containing protein [Cryptosporangium aurantiacum]
MVAAGDSATPSDVATLRDELLTARAEIDGLREAMSRRAVIEQAKGVFMERYGVDDEAAFTRLVTLSQSTNVKLVQIAADVVARSGAVGADGGRGNWIDRALNAFGEPAMVVSPVPTERGAVADFQIDHANRPAVGWTGRSRERLLRATASSLFPGPPATLLLNACRRALATGALVTAPWPADGENTVDDVARRSVRLHAVRISTVVLVTWQTLASADLATEGGQARN